MNLWDWLKQELKAILVPMASTDNEPVVVVVAPPEAPTSSVVPSSTPSNMLGTFCLAIRDFEGAPGDLNYKNNNPGNCRCSPQGYLPKYGNVKCVNNFSVFPTYELGWEYLEALVEERAKLHSTWTILDFFTDYSPPSDGNDPSNYAAFVAKRCGVVPSITLKQLFSGLA